MSASAITEALITNLSAASVLGSGNVSKNYQVLESSSTCCCVVGWVGFRNAQNTFGAGAAYSSETVWTYALRGFVKDTGSPSAVLDRVRDFPDVILSSLHSDDTLQGTVEEIVQVRASRNPNLAFDAGGATWLLMEFEVDVREYL